MSISQLIYRLYLLLFIINIAAVANAQQDTSFIPVVAYWHKGDTYHFRVNKIDRIIRNALLEKDDSTNYNSTFTVLDSTTTGYKIQWTFDRPSAGKMFQQFPETPPLDLILSKIIYTTDEYGSILDIVNIAEIIDAIDYYYLQAGLNVNKEPAAQALKNHILKEPTSAISLFFAEINYFHLLYGMEYSQTDTIMAPKELNNFIGKQSVNATEKIHISALDTSIAFASFTYEIQPDTLSIKKAWLQHFKKESPFTSSKKITQRLNQLSYIYHFNILYDFFYGPGIPSSMRLDEERDIKVEDTSMKAIQRVMLEIYFKEEE